MPPAVQVLPDHRAAPSSTNIPLEHPRVRAPLRQSARPRRCGDEKPISGAGSPSRFPTGSGSCRAAAPTLLASREKAELRSEQVQARRAGKRPRPSIRPPAERRAAAWRSQGAWRGRGKSPASGPKMAKFEALGAVSRPRKGTGQPPEPRRYAPNRPIPPGSANFKAPGLARRADSGVPRPVPLPESGHSRACRAGRSLGARSFRIDSGTSLRQSAQTRRGGRPKRKSRRVGDLFGQPASWVAGPLNLRQGAVCVSRSCGFLRAGAKRSAVRRVPCGQAVDLGWPREPDLLSAGGQVHNPRLPGEPQLRTWLRFSDSTAVRSRAAHGTQPESPGFRRPNGGKQALGGDSRDARGVGPACGGARWGRFGGFRADLLGSGRIRGAVLRFPGGFRCPVTCSTPGIWPSARGWTWMASTSAYSKTAFLSPFVESHL